MIESKHYLYEETLDTIVAIVNLCGAIDGSSSKLYLIKTNPLNTSPLADFIGLPSSKEHAIFRTFDEPGER